MKKILIVDDEVHIRALMAASLEPLEESEVKILVAKDGKEACEIAEREIPDLIFLDVVMPEMDGFEVAERLKLNPLTSDCYIVFLTSKGEKIDKRKGFEVGCDEFANKPFDPDWLVQKATEVLFK